MKKKAIIIIIIAAALLLMSLIFKDKLIQTYVVLCHEKLETYAEELLSHGTNNDSSYGLWDVNVWADDGMVEFKTGGFGLVANSVYKGFYYSKDNTHKPFQSADIPMEGYGDSAAWTDGTDNHGTSFRITDKWFWFRAAF